MANQEKLKEYNAEPVTYCSKCYSLRIIDETAIGGSYCKECGSTELSESSIEEWERLYTLRYGHKLVTKSTDLTKSPVCQMSPKQLLDLMSKLPDSDSIIYKMFPLAPKEISKQERILWAFTRLSTAESLKAMALLIVKHLRQIV